MRHPVASLAVAVAGALVLGAVAGWNPAAAQSSVTRGEVGDTLPLRPGDLIRLRVWREPDLSGDFPVNEAGLAVLPKIGPVEVASAPPAQLQAAITRKLSVFLTQPSVDVAFLRRVQVVGAVEKPGLYHVDQTMTVSDAIALAGGVTSSGRTDQVEIIRQGQRLPGRVSGRMLISHAAVRSGDQLYIPERSWISRNPATILGALSAITAIVYTVSR